MVKRRFKGEYNEDISNRDGSSGLWCSGGGAKCFARSKGDYRWSSRGDGSYDVLYVDLLHLGMDEEFETVVDRLEEQQLQVNKIVF